MFLTFEAAPRPAMTLPANDDDALVAKVVAAQAAQQAHFEAAEAARAARPVAHRATRLLSSITPKNSFPNRRLVG